MLLKMMPYPSELQGFPRRQLGDSRVVTCTASIPRQYLRWCQSQGEMDPGRSMKKKILMEEKGSRRELVMHPSSTHMGLSFHGTERSMQVEMMSRESLLLSATWETQLIWVLGGPGPLSSGKE